MNGDNKSACWIGLHKSKVYKELPLTDVRGNEIGIVVISECINCGKIKQTTVKTVEIPRF